MTKIETLDGLVLSKICKEISPLKYESIVKKNKLLDGSYHIQTIGEPLRYIEFTAIVNQLQAEKISQMETRGEYLRLTENDREFTGLIDDIVDWKRITLGYIDREKRLYEARIKMIIKEEGTN